jgi:hypothetical protein
MSTEKPSADHNGGSRVSSAVRAVAVRDGEGGGVCYRMTVKGPSAVEGQGYGKVVK